MDNLKEKLNTFTSLVLDDAGTKRDELMDKVQENFVKSSIFQLLVTLEK